MRLSEKTIELNVCAQINQNLGRRILWFGLTQAQEAKAGFDAAMQLNGRVLIFQFKASNKIMRRTGARRFYLEHQQLQTLLNRVQGFRRSVFYVFPLIGNTYELNQANGDLYNNTRLLDVSNLPNPFPQPTTNSFPSRLRSNQIHYADVTPPIVTIHSDPVTVKTESLNDVVKSNFAGADGINHLLFDNKQDLNDVLSDEESYDKAFDFIEPFRKNSRMAVIY